jgi:myo-inositol-1(or 4)-monophosphatase
MEFLDTAMHAAKEAEKIVMSYFEKEKGISNKGPVDLVTKADIESEKMILEIIKKKYPSHKFIMEESGSIQSSSDYTWVIDPIDGTTSFAHNYPFFSISIALMKNNEPILGVVNAPYMKEIFHAVNDKGSFLNNSRISVSKIPQMKDCLLATGFPYDRMTGGEDNLNYLSRVIKKVHDLRRSGSAAMDICYVACGRLDGYWEIGLKIMDTAAARIILKEAGGKITDLEGKEITNDFTRIVASNCLIHDELIRTLEG